MRALRVAPPWGLEALQVVETPAPPPGPGQVLVRMRAVSLNYRDLMIVNGHYPGVAEGAAAGITPFSDGCGVIEAVGPGVTRVATGDRVQPLLDAGDLRLQAFDHPLVLEDVEAGQGCRAREGIPRVRVAVEERPALVEVAPEDVVDPVRRKGRRDR